MITYAVRTLAVVASVCGLGIVPTASVGAQTIPGRDASVAIDEVFTDIEPDAPGCAVGVVIDRSLAYAKGYGLANLDYGLPITPSSTFYLGSVSKQFTAAAVAHAEREGHLSFDDPIRKWIPEIPEYGRTITVRHLVHHTSGLRDYLGLWNLSGQRLEDVHSNDATLELIARQKDANFAAGDEYLYSNTGYFLLSLVVERATGESLREYMRRRFLEPLGMGRSRFNDNRLEVMEERVVGYEATEDGFRIAHPWNFDKVGSGGMYSSIADLVHWDRNYYTEEVGGPGFTEQLLERGVLNDSSRISYAFGLTHGEYRGLSTVSHGGALAGFRSELLRFPEHETTVLVLCNFPSSNPGSRAQRVAEVVLAEHLEPEADIATGPQETTGTSEVALTPGQLDAFTGTWRASVGITVQIEREGEGLTFVQDGRRRSLTLVAENVLLLPASGIELTLSDLVDGRFTTMSVGQGGQTFSAERIDPDTEADRDDSELVGDYYSEELDATYRIVIVDGEPTLEIPPSRSGRLVPAGEDRFRAPSLLIQLDREDDGIRGFTIDAGRVRGIYFERKDRAR